MDIAQNSMVFPPDGGYVPRPIVFDEFGDAFPSVPSTASLAYTADAERRPVESRLDVQRLDQHDYRYTFHICGKRIPGIR